MKALVNGRVFDGERLLEDVTVLIDGERIAALHDAGSPLPAGAERTDLAGHLLAPGFIDVQVNGGGGVLFNDLPTPAGVQAIAASHRRHGTTGLLVTLITDQPAVMEAALDTVTEARRQGLPGLLGIHLEGPYLNPARRGVHPADRIRTPEPDALERLAGHADTGRTLVTLAPEQVCDGFIADLTARGVFVAAGHTAASFNAIQRALTEGMRGFTHLFNAMTPLGSREPGVVGAALADGTSWCSVIVDGIHVHPACLRVALSAKPRGRLLLVTDAMPTVGTNNTHFALLGEPVERRGGHLTTRDGTLAGAHLTMDQAVRNARDLLNVPLTEALRMASLYPAQFLQLDHELGSIQPGYRADLVLLDAELRVQRTWIGGR